MRIHIRITMSREVFGTGHDAGILHTPDHGNTTEPLRGIYIFSERPVVDHRVVGIIIYIQYGSKVVLDAHAFTLFADGFTYLVDEGCILHST